MNNEFKNIYRYLLLLVILLFFYCGQEIAGAEIMPLNELKAGMKGVARTAVQGNKVVEFPVEIISIMKNVFPQRSIILANLDGDMINRTGVAQGMSGSPVYINGKLIGAIAYSFPFSKEAIAGITPIEEMTSISYSTTPQEKKTTILFQNIMEFITHIDNYPNAESIYGKFLGYFPEQAYQDNSASFRPIPIIVSKGAGFASPVMQEWWERNGFIPMMMSGGSASEVKDLQEGDAVAVLFLSGDLQMGGIGTVTHVDKKRVFAFGHPLFNLGDIAMPMAAAEIHTVVPSLYSSFKIGSIGEIIGTFKQDLPAAIYGQLDEKPPLIPLKLVTSYSKQERNYNYVLAEHHLLTPIIANMAISETLSTAESSVYEGTYEVSGTIALEGHPDVIIDNIFSGFLSLPQASTYVASILAYMINNEFEKTKIKTIDLKASISAEQKIAEVKEVRQDKVEVKKGDKVGLKIFLKPFHKAMEVYDFDITIDDKFQEGTYYVLIGGAMEMNKFDYAYFYRAVEIDNLDQIIRLINTIKRNDKLYVRIFRPSMSLVVKNKLMSSLPPTYFDIMDAPQAAGGTNRVFIDHLSDEAVKSDYIITGMKKIVIKVKETK
ncbi:MAG: hypothetical protein A2Y62_07865 [Candidatus Fischerbacteria bacterium RBG_13_37_8]|uniref:Peptidase S55 domain-containing protein n=1 Tax=Candidatus Fischerbacteria bacterium RBG_13_37_8 TaxID=1817863 RepID=A0A1F5V9A8_9BACT|nr:MAG: hypothetical protein A2Y62_07865 [Candidatus Fischerbacteria bacterium RBG_13_37_8]